MAQSSKQSSLRAPQIGVMGSAADLGFSKDLQALAEQTGAALAKQGATTIFGAEKDLDSLSTAAARGARKAGGRTVAITYGKGLGIFDEVADVTIATGLARGGGREFTLALSCDAIITLGGGSGTLNEIVVAYQARIPLIALKDTGGWSEKLAGQYVDDRKKVKIEAASDPADAVAKALAAVHRNGRPLPRHDSV